MPLDGTYGGGGPHGPWCASCKAPITQSQRRVRIRFENDPHGFRGLTGDYHEACGKPFASLAHVIRVTQSGRP